MPKCSFCGGSLPEGRGKLFIRTTGQSLYFCNSKCQKNRLMGRVGVKTRWTTTFRNKKQK